MNVEETICYTCGHCYTQYRREYDAKECCSDVVNPKCNVCECEIEFYKTICDKCLNERRFNEAEKINYSDYDVDCFYDEFSDNYFFEYDEIKEYYDDYENGEVPKWAFACNFEEFGLDADRILENECEDHHEDIYDTLNDIDELHIFIDKWNKKQHAGSYYQDYKKVVLFE